MAYEKDMDIQYDELSKKVTVTFRGKQVKLPGRYKNRGEGMRAGEQYCRNQGWKD